MISTRPGMPVGPADATSLHPDDNSIWRASRIRNIANDKRGGEFLKNGCLHVAWLLLTNILPGKGRQETVDPQDKCEFRPRGIGIIAVRIVEVIGFTRQNNGMESFTRRPL